MHTQPTPQTTQSTPNLSLPPHHPVPPLFALLPLLLHSTLYAILTLHARYQAEKNKGDYPFEADWIHYLERLVQDLDKKYAYFYL